MARAKVQLDFPKSAILWRLQKAVANHEQISTVLESICHEVHLPGQVGPLAVEELIAESLCQSKTEENWAEHPFTNNFYKEDVTHIEITSAGITHVEDWSDDYHDSVIRRIYKGIAGAEFEHLLSTAPETENAQEVPASDRIVTLDHNSAEYIEAVDALKAFERAASESNEFGGLFAEPEDRIRVLSEIGSGFELLRQVRVSAQAVVELLVKTLRFVKAKLPEASLGALASKALDALGKLIDFG